MSREKSSSPFTESSGEFSFGPPLIGALLREPWDAVRRRILERLHERGFDDLDSPHLNVLQYPGPQGMRPSDLAERLRMSKQALNYQLGELEQLGYLERRPDAHDRRSRRIQLTPRGRAAGETMRDSVRETEREWADHFGPKRFAQLRNLLLELNRLSSQSEGPR